MRLLLAIPVIAILSVVARAQDEGDRASAVTSSRPELQSYVVELTELRLKVLPDPELKPSDIVRGFAELKKNGTLDQIETVRLSALANHESVVQFGKTVTVATGFTQTQQGRIRSAQQRSIGTMVRLTATPQNGKVLLKLRYEASRFTGEGTEDSPPDTLTTSFDTALLLAEETPMLVGSTTTEVTSMLLVSILK